MEDSIYTPEPMDCPLCNADSVVISSWISDFRNGKKNIMEVAAAFECHPMVVQHHIKNHMLEPDIVDIPKDMKAIVANARTMIMTLNGWYLRIIDTDEVTLETVNMSTKLAKAINDCLNTLAKIDGLIGEDGLSTNYHDLEKEYARLSELLYTKVCPECRQVILKELE